MNRVVVSSVIILIGGLFSSCVDENKKAEQDAFNMLFLGADLQDVRDYKNQFAGYISEEHLRSADSLYSILIADSTMFASIKTVPDDRVLEKYKLLRQYVKSFPDGLNVYEANEFINEHRREIERAESLRNEFNNLVNKYDYLEYHDGTAYAFVSFSTVDENNIGTCTWYFLDTIRFSTNRTDTKPIPYWFKYKDREYELVDPYSWTVDIKTDDGIIEARLGKRIMNYVKLGELRVLDAEVKNDFINKSIIPRNNKVEESLKEWSKDAGFHVSSFWSWENRMKL